MKAEREAAARVRAERIAKEKAEADARAAEHARKMAEARAAAERAAAERAAAEARAKAEREAADRAMAESMAATRFQALYRGRQARQQASAQVTPTTLAGQVAILRRELSLRGSFADVVHQACAQLMIDKGNKPLATLAAECMTALGFPSAAPAGGGNDVPVVNFGRGGGWSCDVCTFKNPEDASHCCMCTAPRPQAAAMSRPFVVPIGMKEDSSLAPRKELRSTSSEFEQISSWFKKSLSDYERNRVRIISIEKLNNDDMMVMYNMRLQLLAKREANRRAAGKPAVAHDKLELVWAFHGCASEVIENIIASGFNRSYAGKNAVVYGRGVYFARDASYSARETYSPRDEKGHKRMFLCRLALGSHVQVRHGYGSKAFETEPPVRDADRLLGVGTLKHDTTTGGNVQGGVPEIMVAYKDGQGYPEYLVTFTL